MSAAACTALAVLAVLAILTAAAALHGSRRGALSETGGGLVEQAYVLVYGTLAPEAAADRIGLHPERYLKACDLLREDPDLIGAVMYATAGLALIVLGAVAFPFVGMWTMAVGLVLGLLLIRGPAAAKQRKAEARRREFSDGVIPFVNVLQSALDAGMQVGQAVPLVARHLDGLLAEEVRGAMTEAKLGASGWCEALEAVADLYEDPGFSELVMTLSGAARRGVPVAETVRRQNTEAKASLIARARMEAGKMSNIIMAPVAVFHLLPMMAVMLIPVFGNMQMGLF